jgi:hypothetical protein
MATGMRMLRAASEGTSTSSGQDEKTAKKQTEETVSNGNEDEVRIER